MPRPADSSFPRRLRIRRHGEFRHVLKQGRRSGDRVLLIWALPNGLACTRLGLIVGRKHGNAVRRNRIKRVIREAFRLSRQRLPNGLDIACAPRVGVAITLRDAMESLARVTERLARTFQPCG